MQIDNSCKGIEKQKCNKNDCEFYNSQTNKINVLCKNYDIMKMYSQHCNTYHKNDCSKINKKNNKRCVIDISSITLKYKDLYYDFCNGLRVISKINSYYIKMIDNDSQNVYFENIIEPNKCYYSPIFYYMRWRLQVYDLNKKLLFVDNLNLKNKKVAITCPSTIGDTLSSLPSIIRFKKYHKCKITLYVNETLIKCLQNTFKKQFIIKNNLYFKNDGFYAVYRINCGVNLNSSQRMYATNISCLSYQSNYILGFYDQEAKKIQLKQSDDTLDILKDKKYVCYSCVASSEIKEWNNPEGWKKVIQFLQKEGFIIVNLDVNKTYDFKDVIYLNGKHLDIQSRINVLKKSQFYIGMGSGLSWVAHYCNIPVVLISGFSLPLSEFSTPYRIISNKGCYGCYNIVNSNPFTCLFEGTQREYECSKNITPELIITNIKKLIKNENIK